MTFPKDHINIGRHGTKFPFIIPVVRKIFPLHISQFNKLVFFSIEGCHGRQLISIRFFFQCPESCIVKGKLCPVFFVEFILIAALTVVGIYVFVCKVLSSDIFFSAWMKIAVPVSTDLEDDMIFFIEDLCKHEIAPGAATTTAQFILRFGLVAVMLVGGILVTAGSLSIPMFILFLLFAGRIYDPFTSCFMLMAEVFSSLVSVILEPIIEIVISLVLGALSGLALNWLETYFHSRSKRLSLTVAFVLLMVGISSMEFELGGVKIGFSLLLVCMMTGTVFCNVCSASEELMSRLDRWTGPINILFFVLSGAELDLNILSNPLVLLIGIIYIVFRSLGKISGSYISCAMTKCSDHIKKHLGITLLPQAGVALGMALTATSLTDGSIVRNVVLFSVLVYELIGPSLTKRSLLAAGEIKPEGKTSAREENKPVKPITLK